MIYLVTVLLIFYSSFYKVHIDTIFPREFQYIKIETTPWVVFLMRGRENLWRKRKQKINHLK